MLIKIVRFVAWLCLGALFGAVYGIVNDQLTVTLAPEYFSVFKRAQFAQPLEAAGLLDAPTRVQALVVGALATWWFGLILGIILSLAGLGGRRRPIGTIEYLRAVGAVMAFALCLSALFGAIAWLAEPVIAPTADNWPFLRGIVNVRAAFGVGWWHNGAYLGGGIGTIAAAVWVRRRRSDARAPTPPSP